MKVKEINYGWMATSEIEAFNIKNGCKHRELFVFRKIKATNPARLNLRIGKPSSI